MVWDWPLAVNWRACWVARFATQLARQRCSTFTLYLPQTYLGPSVSNVLFREGQAFLALPIQLPASCGALSTATIERVADDRENITSRDGVLLIVEDDPHYARMLCDLAHDTGFKVLAAMNGSEALPCANSIPQLYRWMSSCRTCCWLDDGPQSFEAGPIHTAYPRARDVDAR